jgi:hypothetical protein
MNLTLEQYEALASLARRGATTSEQVLNLDAFLRSIEKANSIKRSSLWVQWQESDQPLPPTTNFPAVWPPEMRFYIEFLTRSVTQDDVARVLAARAKKPVNVLVTPDPAALLGWVPVASFFV